MARLTPRFSANRTVREYPSSTTSRRRRRTVERAADKGAVGRQIVYLRHALEEKWSTLRFGEVSVETKDEQHVFEVRVYLNDLDPGDVQVELYADALDGAAPLRKR